METIIETHQLSKTFDRTKALHDISIQIKKGAPVGLIGPNGAGKTTLFSLLCGFLKPTKGDIKIFNVNPLYKTLYGKVAILPQDAAFIKAVPIYKQLIYMAELQGFRRKDAKSEAERVLDLVDLTDVRKKYPEMLSHGMLKRVAIAQTFIGEPELVLLDEPTAGLDANTVNNIRNLIRSQDQEKTFMISSHNIEEIEDLCETVVILNKGALSGHFNISELVSRKTSLTFRLNEEPPDDIEKCFNSIPEITQIERGKQGERKLYIHFSANNEDQVQIKIIQMLNQHGIQFLEMSRGQSLEHKVKKDEFS